MKIQHLRNESLKSIISTDPRIQLGSHAEITASTIHGPVNINAMAFINRCVLGKYFSIGLYASMTDTEVGRYCTFGSRVSIGGFNHPTNWLSIHESSYRDTLGIWGESIHPPGTHLLRTHDIETAIGNDVWIGDNVVVVRGAHIADGAIIGAGSVVTRPIPAYSIAVGNPAKVIRSRFSQIIIDQLLSLQWWDLDMAELKGIDFKDIEAAIATLVERKQGSQDI